MEKERLYEQIEAYLAGDLPGEERRSFERQLAEDPVLAAEGADMNLGEFLEQVALVSETDNLDEAPNATTLLTLHAAKGLEFPIVFLTGLEDGLLPHSRSLDEAEELAEERRLFYVGITRAKDRVYISHAFRRTFYGDSAVSVPSRFLGDIPEALTDGDSSAVKREKSKKRVSSWQTDTTWSKPQSSTRWSADGGSGRFQSPSQRPRPRHLEPDPFAQGTAETKRGPQYRAGMRVNHGRFGDGVVIESKMTGDDEEVTVAFADVGLKRLSASFAKLDIIQ